MGGKRWNLAHNPMSRPLGCNRKYGNSGGSAHRRRGEAPCEKCLTSQSHYQRERRRGALNPKRLKPCGTWAAAARHRAKGEPVDFECAVAEAQYQQDRRDSRKNP